MRERWPYAEDRAIIDQFLLGNPARSDDSYLTSEAGHLKFYDSVIAHYDTAGALVVAIPGSGATSTFYAERAANYMLEAVGAEQRVTREGEPTDVWRWAFDGRFVAPNEPLVLVGAMGLAAYRATVSNRKE